ncbi:MAG TPA: 16S rRNA (cytosine(1402)-N(4))-methyltransferase, partial [Gemmatales bacterium]|nr:16S rRNA (cytosine(1402)-N(4))-methyltransferase [Gemmatales bacterium]
MNPKRPRHRRPPRRSTPPGGHRAVLLDQVVQVLAPQPGEVVLDAPLGLAGHAATLLQHVGAEGRLLGLDLDAANLDRARETLTAVGFPFSVHHANFAAAEHVVGEAGVGGGDLVVAGLGVGRTSVGGTGGGVVYVRA